MPNQIAEYRKNNELRSKYFDAKNVNSTTCLVKMVTLPVWFAVFCYWRNLSLHHTLGFLVLIQKNNFISFNFNYIYDSGIISKDTLYFDKMCCFSLSNIGIVTWKSEDVDWRPSPL